MRRTAKVEEICPGSGRKSGRMGSKWDEGRRRRWFGLVIIRNGECGATGLKEVAVVCSCYEDG